MAEHTFTHLAFDALEGRLTVTVEEAASVLGLGRSAAYEAARRGEIPSRRLGRRIVVPVPLLRPCIGQRPGGSPAQCDRAVQGVPRNLGSAVGSLT
ncbi:MAG: helix-turn-helix domain-containing protein [Actinomycetota bacterium]|nr:helix-turn-helix domain-containing protein [Actinomycetota bacterium]